MFPGEIPPYDAVGLHLLWVELVQCSVHSDGDAERVEVAVLTDFVDHGGERGAAQLGRSLRHHAAHLLHQDAVVTRAAGQTQVLQDGADLTQGQTVTDGGGERERNPLD